MCFIGLVRRLPTCAQHASSCGRWQTSNKHSRVRSNRESTESTVNRGWSPCAGSSWSGGRAAIESTCLSARPRSRCTQAKVLRRQRGISLEILPVVMSSDGGARLLGDRLGADRIVLASPGGNKPPLDPKSNEQDFKTDMTRRFEADSTTLAALGSTVEFTRQTCQSYASVATPAGFAPACNRPRPVRFSG